MTRCRPDVERAKNFFRPLVVLLRQRDHVLQANKLEELLDIIQTDLTGDEIIAKIRQVDDMLSWALRVVPDLFIGEGANLKLREPLDVNVPEKLFRIEGTTFRANSAEEAHDHYMRGWRKAHFKNGFEPVVPVFAQVPVTPAVPSHAPSQRVCTVCAAATPSSKIEEGWISVRVENSKGNRSHREFCPNHIPKYLQVPGFTNDDD